jgi:Domain of unknown function (DUF929)
LSRLLGVCVALSLLVTGAAAAVIPRDGSLPAPASVARLVTHVPATVLDKVGAGQVSGQTTFMVSKLHGAVLRSAGKPELLATIFAWCPHCAAHSWSLAVALSRFGTLSRVRVLDTGTFYPQFHHTPRPELRPRSVQEPVSHLCPGGPSRPTWACLADGNRAREKRSCVLLPAGRPGNRCRWPVGLRRLRIFARRADRKELV